MNQADFRHNFINPLYKLNNERDNIKSTLKRYCRAGNCHEAKAAIKELDKVDVKINMLIVDNELQILNALSQTPTSTIMAQALKASTQMKMEDK